MTALPDLGGMRSLLFLLGILLLLVPEILRVYFIMPFPGSQENMPTDLRQVYIAYWLHNNIWWVRLIALALVALPAVHFWRMGKWWRRALVVLPLLLCGVVIYAFNFKFMADKMFYPPKQKVMHAPAVNDSSANSLVIAVERNGDARAYPIELIGYHHQVLDTIGGEPVLVTYCTVCRTGRAFKPEVNGEPETFRLVGMDHFNAMFEDSRTGSWWRQVSGECIVGPLKGMRLEEVPSRQLTLREFADRHPEGLVFQPDSSFMDQYTDLDGFDEGTIESSLEYRDSASWEPKSWVVGVVHNGQARAYDWNDIQRVVRILDTLGGDSILVLRSGTNGFKTMRYADLPFAIRPQPLKAYQEFWHSWRTFHPNTTRYEPKR